MIDGVHPPGRGSGLHLLQRQQVDGAVARAFGPGLGVVDLHRVGDKGPLDHLEVIGQQLAPIRLEILLGLDLVGHPFEKKTVGGLGVTIEALADLKGVFQGLFHRLVEPELDAAGDEIDGKNKQDGGGQEGEDDEGHHQARAQIGPHHLVTALVEELYQVTEDQENQKDKQYQVDIDDDEHQHGIGDGNGAAEMDDPRLGVGQHRHHHQDDDNEDPFALAAPAFILGEMDPGGLG